MNEQTLFVKGKLVEVKNPDGSTNGDKQSVLDEWRPLDYVTKWVEDRIDSAGTIKNRSLMLHSSTGSGKSTILPPELFHKFFIRMGRRNICCTQPRVLTSIEMPSKIIPFQTGTYIKQGRVPIKLGDNIGFQTGAVAKRPTRGMIFMTIGVLKQQLNVMTPDEIMKRYSFIIIDEAHERSVDTDLVLYMMKKLIKNANGAKECPFLIIMSATFDPHKFAKYLSLSTTLSLSKKDEKEELLKETEISIIQVTGFTFPINDEHGWLEYDTTNYIKSAVETVAMIHEKHLDDILPRDELANWMASESSEASGYSENKKENKKGGKEKKKKLVLDDDALEARIKEQVFRDILVFVAGEADARQIITKISELNSTNKLFQKYPVMPIQLMGVDVESRSEGSVNISKDLSKLGVEVRSFGNGSRKIVKPTRRVIVASNVAETGVTFNTLRHVVDTGFLKSSEYDPIYRASLLITRPVTKGMHIQRRGRAGRRAPGFAWYLYTKETFKNLQDDQFPNIIKEDITLELLTLLIKEGDEEGKNVSETLVRLTKDNEWLDTLAQNVVNMYDFDLLDPPSADTIHTSLDRLYTAGAINSNSTPTMLGVVMNKFRMLPLESIKMILAGYAWEAPILDLITIAASLQLRTDMSAERDRDPDASLMEFEDAPSAKMSLMTSCDFCTMLLAWDKYQRLCAEILDEVIAVPEDDSIGNLHSRIVEWCKERNVSPKYFEDLTQKREDIIHNMAGIGLNPYSWNNKSLSVRNEIDIREWTGLIKQCIFDGYKSNILVWNPVISTYETRFGNIKVAVDRGYLMTAGDIRMYGVQNPKYLVYDVLSFRQNRKNQYPPQVRYVSVLDGFVPFDLKFDS